MEENKHYELRNLEMKLEYTKNTLKIINEYHDFVITRQKTNEKERIELENTLNTIDDNIRHTSSCIRHLAKMIKTLKNEDLE